MQYRINSIATVIAAFAITFMTPQIEATTPKTSATDGRFRLMSVSKDAQLRRQLPRVDDKQIHRRPAPTSRRHRVLHRRITRKQFRR